MTMDARKQRVLQAIVALYGLEGEPVGSSVLANYFDMAVSSATLRNEMAALTKLGLLEQPHTSAGRVPSAKGYRYYLDNLLTDDQPLDRVTRARVDAVFASLDHEPEKLAQGAAKALAAISGCTAAVSTPCAEDLCIAHYEVVQVGRSAAAVLAVTTAGYVRTRVARVRTGLSRENAAALAAKAFFETLVLENKEQQQKLIVLGPSPARISKISNTYRYRLAIKCKNSKSVRNLLMQVLKATVKMKELRKVQISIDLNPIDLG